MSSESSSHATEGKMPRWSAFTLGERIGSGGYANVYRGSDTISGHVVALKKSRVSLRVKRSLLQHEARILQLLQGHPAIPAILAYGRFEHFEYMAMPLLGPSIRELHESPSAQPLKTVLLVAQQMLSALHHIHSHGIIHRDIKPENMLTCLEDPSKIYLIDFGLACRQPTEELARYDPVTERTYPMGTPNWVSLDAHHGATLSCRDDLESLAFTLLFLLRGELPWKTHANKEETLVGSMARIREKKRNWPGSRLAQNHPEEFGQLLDYARGLRFDEQPDYPRLLSSFEKFYTHSGFGDDKVLKWTTPDIQENKTTPATNEEKVPYRRMVKPGQIVYIEVLAGTTIQGPNMAGDPSFWCDPIFSTDQWSTPPRPAIVLCDYYNSHEKRYIVEAVPLRRGRPFFAESKGIVPVQLTSSPSRSNLPSISPLPAWPLDDTFAYVFPRAERFLCSPEQAEPIKSHWTVSPEDMKILSQQLDQSPPPLVTPDETSVDADERADAQMKKRADYHVYAKITALNPKNLSMTSGGVSVWTGERGWFDELVKISRRHMADDGWEWTASNGPPRSPRLSDSYFGWDISDWDNRQHERGRSLTIDREEAALLDMEICQITEILPRLSDVRIVS